MYDPLDRHKENGCSWYCRDGLHAMPVMSKNKQTATLEIARREINILTGGMLEVVSIRYAPESQYDIHDGTWSKVDERLDYPCLAMVRYTKRWHDMASSTEADTLGA